MIQMVYIWIRCSVLFCEVPWLAQDSGWFVFPGTTQSKGAAVSGPGGGQHALSPVPPLLLVFEMKSPCVARDDLP